MVPCQHFMDHDEGRRGFFLTLIEVEVELGPALVRRPTARFAELQARISADALEFGEGFAELLLTAVSVFRCDEDVCAAVGGFEVEADAEASLIEGLPR